MSIAEPKDDGRVMWFTSTYSNGAGGECVECALTDERALVRDSKNADGPVVTVGGETWRSFIGNVKGGSSAR